MVKVLFFTKSGNVIRSEKFEGEKDEIMKEVQTALDFAGRVVIGGAMAYVDSLEGIKVEEA